MILQVEVDVATARPPRVHARTWTWVSAETAVEAELTAIAMAECDPRVVMVVGARIIDWIDEE